MIQKLIEECCKCTSQANSGGFNAPDVNIAGPGLTGLNAPNLPGSLQGFSWPGIDEPGFPTLIAGCLGASLAGLNVILDFVPIKLDDNGAPKIPDLPGIDIFIKGFTGSAIGLPKLSAASIPVPGVGNIPLPDIPGKEIPDINLKRLDGTSFSALGFDPSAILKVIGLLIGAPFLIIKEIIESIPSLNIKLPTIDGIKKLFLDAIGAMGIEGDAFGLCIGCIAKAIFELIGMILPI